MYISFQGEILTYSAYVVYVRLENYCFIINNSIILFLLSIKDYL